MEHENVEKVSDAVHHLDPLSRAFTFGRKEVSYASVLHEEASTLRTYAGSYELLSLEQESMTERFLQLCFTCQTSIDDNVYKADCLLALGTKNEVASSQVFRDRAALLSCQYVTLQHSILALRGSWAVTRNLEQTILQEANKKQFHADNLKRADEIHTAQEQHRFDKEFRIFRDKRAALKIGIECPTVPE
jgi:hypothetical protein